MVQSRGVRILVAEDDEDIRVLVERIFAHVGVAVSSVADGAAALRGLADQPPDCLVVDPRMPDVDGMDVLSELARSGSTVPVVLLTASVEPEVEVQALAAGAVAVVRKPFQTKVLVSVVARAIRGAQPDRELPPRLVELAGA
ncbi:response regulator [Pedococcus sp. 2YAF34]|uniref:response regulator n=1 Tax=Pedococcus sp. 2YAF34 TaxID=3233032 RepID=UPI003F9CB4B3